MIEHAALTTHNVAQRHWDGDHGPLRPVDHVLRVETAIRNHDFALGHYIDVHAWYFTPDSFRSIIETLGALGLTRLELAGVYDSARDRNEFCAVLRFNAEWRALVAESPDEGGIIVLQTADAEHYAPMLAITATNVREYCRRHGLGYESFVGVKRGFHPWQASFNRIPMLVELIERGFAGWALYLDADAYIQDLDFDLAAYLADKGDRAAIFAMSGVSDAHWDINDGVALINLGHPLGRAMVYQWAAGFAAHSDDFLREADEWIGPGNDQDLLHRILQRDPAIAGAVLVEKMSFLNGPHASFIRQQLRTMSDSFDERLEAVAQAVSAAMRSIGRAAPGAPDDADQLWAARLAHPAGRLPVLLEAPVPPVRLDLAEKLCAGWSDNGLVVENHQRALADALSRADVAAVASELAALSRTRFADERVAPPVSDLDALFSGPYPGSLGA